MEYIEDGCFADYFYTFGLVRIKDRKLPKNLIKAITPKLPKRHESGWLPASQQSKDYVVVHLIDKDSDPKLINITIFIHLIHSMQKKPGNTAAAIACCH